VDKRRLVVLADDQGSIRILADNCSGDLGVEIEFIAAEQFKQITAVYFEGEIDKLNFELA